MATTNIWSIDQAHSEISFKVRHLLISNIKGSFKKIDVSVHTNDKNFETAEIDLSIEVASIDTGDALRDEHLKSEDFFDVKNYPQITFTSNGIAKADTDGNQKLWGYLTLKGITKPVRFNVQYDGIIYDLWGNEKAGFSVTGKINRMEWGLVLNNGLETGGAMIGEDVTISCEFDLINSTKKQLAIESAQSNNLKLINQSN
ncbi:MAG: YceI family protein [Chitinophagales bacterium]|nr:YceI family protein [Chitinophagales bacterium]